MDLRLEPFQPAHREAVVALALRAWEPVFASIEQALEPGVYREHYPDWRAQQRAAVEVACADADMRAMVATVDGVVAGFAVSRLHREDRMGEIHMVAVDPKFQRRGIARALTQDSLEWLKAQGMTTAMVETGGDPGHAPARQAYEDSGFRPFPVARYFRTL